MLCFMRWNNKMDLKVCEECQKKTVMMRDWRGEEGRSETCLNCGWYTIHYRLDDEELIRHRENYPEHCKKLDLEEI